MLRLLGFVLCLLIGVVAGLCGLWVVAGAAAWCGYQMVQE